MSPPPAAGPAPTASDLDAGAAGSLPPSDTGGEVGAQHASDDGKGGDDCKPKKRKSGWWRNHGDDCDPPGAQTATTTTTTTAPATVAPPPGTFSTFTPVVVTPIEPVAPVAPIAIPASTGGGVAGPGLEAPETAAAVPPPPVAEAAPVPDIGPSESDRPVPRAVRDAARSVAGLLILAGLAAAFLAIQGRLDRWEPKLADAPLEGDSLDFE